MDLIQTVVVSVVAPQGSMTFSPPNTSVVTPQIRRGSRPAVRKLFQVRIKDCSNVE
jgi:hypothetical protein